MEPTPAGVRAASSDSVYRNPSSGSPRKLISFSLSVIHRQTQHKPLEETAF